MSIAASLLPLSLALAGPVGPHAEHSIERPRPTAAPALVSRDLTPATFSSWVYGYYAWWAGTVADIRWDRVSHVALFNVELTSEGTFIKTDTVLDVIDEALALAEPYGARVHIAAICFDDVTMAAVLPDPVKRGKAVDALAAMVADTGAHGVAVDFEAMDKANRADLVTFVTELRAVVPEVTVATPAIDWSKAYDYAGLAAASDGLFIMAYGYHWSGGDPGPVSPLFGGAPWSKYSVEWTLNDHIAAGAPASKPIVGLPLYGRNWATTDNSVPGTKDGPSKAIVYADAVAEVKDYERLWDEVTRTPYYFPSATSQVWYDDLESLDEKIGWSVDQGALGVGFWALNYEGGDPAFWDMVAKHTQVEPEPEPEPEPTTSGGATEGETGSTGGTDDTGGSGGSSDGDTGGGTSAGDTGGGASAGTSGGGGASDSDGAASGTSGDESGAGAEEEEGCGCTAGSRGGDGVLGVLGVLGILGLRQRRRR